MQEGQIGTDGNVFGLLADAVLVLHFLFALFIVAGLVAVFAGKLMDWHWVRNRRFRIAHLAAIAVVVLQSWFGMICPVTTLEMWLRQRAGGATYEGAFIGHWVGELLYYDLPAWVFIVIYTLFAALVAASWVWVPPTLVMDKRDEKGGRRD